MWLLNPGSEPFCFTEQYPPKLRTHTSTHILTHTSKKWILNRIQLKSKIVAYHLFVSIYHMNTWMYLIFQRMCKQLFWIHNMCRIWIYYYVYYMCVRQKCIFNWKRGIRKSDGVLCWATVSEWHLNPSKWCSHSLTCKCSKPRASGVSI